ncbi:MAG: tRNA (adenosine(37)-N6)-threonylcarbamoyltransferase complex ATPase subunit type 1 TsaE [Bacteroidota bacterium]
MIFELNSVDEVAGVAEKLLEACGTRKVFAIFGDLGAGKTTLVKAICLQLGAGAVAKSPTFAIVNEYEGKAGSIYHFDLYRIEREEELYDLGFEEYIDSGTWCFIEWPEIAVDLLPEDTVEVTISATGPTSRTINVELQDLN